VGCYRGSPRRSESNGPRTFMRSVPRSAVLKGPASLMIDTACSDLAGRWSSAIASTPTTSQVANVCSTHTIQPVASALAQTAMPLAPAISAAAELS
jgi:hypothetical protein